MSIEESVPAALAGERIDRVVAMMTGASRSVVAEWLAQGLVRRDGVVVTTRSLRLDEDDLVTVDVDPDAPRAPLRSEPLEIRIVHSDEDVLVIDKAPGIVVHPGAGNETGTLVQGLLHRYPEIASVGDPRRPGIVHRLDKDTSGLMIVARSAAAYEALTASLAAHEVSRSYLTLVWGVPESGSGMVDAPIGRSAREPTRMVVSASGKEARTRYEVVQAFDAPAPLALVRCELETGRTHQIRVHLSAIGHPVVGDVRYRGVRQSLPVPRIFLHSASLGFDHPVRAGERLEFDSPLPDDLAGVLTALGRGPSSAVGHGGY